jgi:hypothetical protein
MGPAAISLRFSGTRLRPRRPQLWQAVERRGRGMGDVAAPSEKRMSGASIALPAAFQRANLGQASSTPRPAAVASRVGTVDDDFRISRVPENPEVTRHFFGDIRWSPTISHELTFTGNRILIWISFIADQRAYPQTRG